MKLYKITSPNGKPVHGGSGNWHLPAGKKPGKWMPMIDDVRCCSRGYHLVKRSGILSWLAEPAIIWEAEGRGDSNSDGSDKAAYAEARLLRPVGLLNARSLRLAAADYAERVLPIFEQERPNDKRCREAVAVARAFARGEIDDAARDAAGAAAGAAARDAAGAAARAAAWAAAGAAEKKWQIARLLWLAKKELEA